MEAAERGKSYSAGLLEKAISRGRSTQEKADELLARITPTDEPAAAAGADLVIEAVFEDPAVKAQVFAEIEPLPRARRAARLEHLDAADHRAGRGRHAAGRLHRAALLQPGGQDAAAGDHQGREDQRRDPLPGARPGKADQEDADRGQRLARLLHQPRDRDLHQRGRGHAAGGRSRGLDRAGLQPGRLPRPGAPAQRRAQPQPRAQDPRRHQGRDRGRRGRVRGPGLLPGRRPPARAGARRQARRRRLLRLRGRQAGRSLEGPQRAVPGDRGPVHAVAARPRGADAVHRVDRGRQVPRRGRDRDRRGRQHRLDPGDRLPGLDRRRAPVHRRLRGTRRQRARRLRGPCPRARGTVRRALRAAGLAGREGRAGRALQRVRGAGRGDRA